MITRVSGRTLAYSCTILNDPDDVLEQVIEPVRILQGIRSVLTVAGGLSKVAPGRGNVTKVNVASLLAEAALSLQRGQEKRAALLFGAATLAARSSALGWVIQGGLVLDRLRRRLV